MLQKLQERIVEITKAIEQTVAHHNFLSGSLQEAHKALEFYSAHQEEIKKIAEEAENPKECIEDIINCVDAIIADQNDGATPNE